jgi:hypothetical protein
MVLIPVLGPPWHSDQVIKGGTTHAGPPRSQCHNSGCPPYRFQRALLYQGRAPALKEPSVAMRLKGSALRATARGVQIRPTTIINPWQKKRRRSPQCTNRFSTRCILPR